MVASIAANLLLVAITALCQFGERIRTEKPPHVATSIETPNVRGMPRENAKALLSRQGPIVSTMLRQTDQKLPGTVIDHRPSPGTVVRKGQRVELLIAAQHPTGRLPTGNIR